jgi:cation transport protein ChaC
VVLGLDRGGSCIGVAYRLLPASRNAAISGLFEREIPNPAASIYLARRIAVNLPDGQRVAALTFVADRARVSYQRLSDAEVIERLIDCHGQRGPNREYAVNTWHALHERGVHDARLQRYVRLLADRQPKDAPAP